MTRGMPRIAAWLLAAVLAFALAGCSRDPVADDLKHFDEHAQRVLKLDELRAIEKKMQGAQGSLDQADVMNEYANAVARQVDALSNYQPKTPEVSQLTQSLQKGMMEMVEGARSIKTSVDAVRRAQERQDRDAAMAAIGRIRVVQEKLEHGQQSSQAALAGLRSLAQQKGVKLKL